ncbi:hypothetical protein ACOMHN_050464 [Nucella lapillus]
MNSEVLAAFPTTIQYLDDKGTMVQFEGHQLAIRILDHTRKQLSELIVASLYLVDPNEGFLDTANILFQTQIPPFVGSQMTVDLKAAYNYNRARLQRHCGQYEQALNSAQHALDLTREEEKTREVRKLIERLTLERDTGLQNPDPNWLEGTNAYQPQAGRSVQENDGHRQAGRSVQQENDGHRQAGRSVQENDGHRQAGRSVQENDGHRQAGRSVQQENDGHRQAGRSVQENDGHRQAGRSVQQENDGHRQAGRSVQQENDGHRQAGRSVQQENDGHRQAGRSVQQENDGHRQAGRSVQQENDGHRQAGRSVQQENDGHRQAGRSVQQENDGHRQAGRSVQENDGHRQAGRSVQQENDGHRQAGRSVQENDGHRQAGRSVQENDGHRQAGRSVQQENDGHRQAGRSVQENDGHRQAGRSVQQENDGHRQAGRSVQENDGHRQAGRSVQQENDGHRQAGRSVQQENDGHRQAGRSVQQENDGHRQAGRSVQENDGHRQAGRSVQENDGHRQAGRSVQQENDGHRQAGRSVQQENDGHRQAGRSVQQENDGHRQAGRSVQQENDGHRQAGRSVQENDGHRQAGRSVQENDGHRQAGRSVQQENDGHRQAGRSVQQENDGHRQAGRSVQQENDGHRQAGRSVQENDGHRQAGRSVQQENDGHRQAGRSVQENDRHRQAGRSVQQENDGHRQAGRSVQQENDGHRQAGRSVQENDGHRQAGRSVQQENDGHRQAGRSVQQENDGHRQAGRSVQQENDGHRQAGRSVQENDGHRQAGRSVQENDGHRQAGRSVQQENDGHRQAGRSVQQENDGHRQAGRSVQQENDGHRQAGRSVQENDGHRQAGRSVQQENDGHRQAGRSVQQENDGHRQAGRSVQQENDGHRQAGRSVQENDGHRQAGRSVQQENDGHRQAGRSVQQENDGHRQAGRSVQENDGHRQAGRSVQQENDGHRQAGRSVQQENDGHRQAGRSVQENDGHRQAGRSVQQENDGHRQAGRSVQQENDGHRQAGRSVQQENDGHRQAGRSVQENDGHRQAGRSVQENDGHRQAGRSVQQENDGHRQAGRSVQQENDGHRQAGPENRESLMIAKQAEKQRWIRQDRAPKAKHKRPKRAVPTSGAGPCVETAPAFVSAALLPSLPTPRSAVLRPVSAINRPPSPSASRGSPPALYDMHDDHGSEDETGDVPSVPPAVRYLPDGDDGTDDCPEDLLEKVVTLLPEDKNENWYDYSVNGSLPEQSNIDISQDQLRQYEKPSKRAPFYAELTSDPQEVEQMLSEEPERYRRCQLVSISAHEALAKVLGNTRPPSHIWIHGRSKIGQTFLDEEVVVELLAQPQHAGGQAHGQTHAQAGAAWSVPSSDRLAHGRVVGTVRMAQYADVPHPVFLCTVDDWDPRLMLPLCRTVPKLYVLQRQPTEAGSPLEKRVDVYRITQDGDFEYRNSFRLSGSTVDQYVFRVVYVTWRYRKSVYPLGVVISVHRTGRDYISGLELLAVQHRLPSLYSAEVIEDTRRLTADTGTPSDSTEDLKGKRTFTIDPPGSRDLDDALCVWREGPHYVVAVHVTDVAAVVNPGSPVDEEARRRSVTFYPPHSKPHAMLPEPLSHGQCSLLPGQDRRCLSVLFKLNEKGRQVRDPWVRQTEVRSYNQLTYAEVQTVLEGSPGHDLDGALCEDIAQLHRFAVLMRETREKTSRLFVPFEDARLKQRGATAKHRDAHRLVEEWMIAANAVVARRLTDKFPNVMILRCQSPPSDSDMQEWLDKVGYGAYLPIRLQEKKVSPNTTLSLEAMPPAVHSSQQRVILQAEVWRRLSQHVENGEVEEARRLAFMDSVHPLQCLATAEWMDLMLPAEYRSSSGLSGPQRRHFSLDLEVYTNFTSPLRRYVDLHVQRLLHADLNGTDPHCEVEEVIQLCQDINTVIQRQRSFDKSCRDLEVASHVQAQPLVFRAFLSCVDKEKLTLRLPSLLHTSAGTQEVPFSSLGVSRQPEIVHDTMLKQTSADVQWNKRIYDDRGTCPGSLRAVWSHLDRTNSVDMVVSREQLTVCLKARDWAGVVRALIQDNLSALPRVPQPLAYPSAHVDYMCSEKGTGAVSLRPVHYRTTFTAGQVLQVQLSAKSARGILVPQVDLFCLAHHSHVCLRHTKSPVDTLTRCADCSTRGQQFFSHEQYLHAWMPLLEMEASSGAGFSDAAVTIHNVRVVMNTPQTGSFSLTAKFCTDRCINIGGKSPDSIRQENLRNQSAFPLDYVCLRYAMNCPGQVLDLVKQADLLEVLDSRVTWLAHAGVTSVLQKGKREADGGRLEVSLALCPSAPPPPSALLERDGGQLTVEILPKSDVDRRAQELMLQLDDAGCEVARALAYGDSLPDLDEEHAKLGEEFEGRDVQAYTPGGRRLPPNNTRQQEAVRKALTSTLTLIQGPPGTGKTYTGIKLIYLFTLINRRVAEQGGGSSAVLFCGPSNKSVDLVANLLREKLGGECVKMVRVYGASLEMKAYPAPRGELRSRRGGQDLLCDQRLNDVALHNLIREDGKKYAEEICAMEKLFGQKGAGDSGGVSNGQVKRYRQLLFEACVHELGHYEVIFTTCAVAGSQRLIQGMRGRVFQVMIDECAMCPEPLSMVPVVASQARQVVLIGDHRQLRPILTCSAAADLGLKRSLFERLFRQWPDHTVLLDLQYRMHPQLCQFPSQQFYKGQLRTALSMSWTQDPLPFWPDNVDFGQGRSRALNDPANRQVPHVFVDVRGEEEKKSVSDEEGNENSRSNSLEADKVVEIVRYLKQHEVHLANVRILTQYKAQRHLLESRLHKECEDRNQTVFTRYDKEHISVSTVVSSQGGEWEYVVWSTVVSLPPYKVEKMCTQGWRHKNLGFITDCNQVNVAITRPRLGLFIVGNEDLLRCDPTWDCLLETYQQQGCIFPAQLFPPGSNPAPPGTPLHPSPRSH